MTRLRPRYVPVMRGHNFCKQWLIDTQEVRAVISEDDGTFCLEELWIDPRKRTDYEDPALLAVETLARAKGSQLLLVRVSTRTTRRPEARLTRWYRSHGYRAVKGTGGWYRYKKLGETQC